MAPRRPNKSASPARRGPGIFALHLAAALVLAAASSTAFAYRPFDSTDADVVDDGEFELELGPLGGLREGSKRFLVAPAVVANLGISGNREIVAQGQGRTSLDRDPGEPRSSIVDTGLFVKQVLREGALQDKTGPSIATEYGLLLPEVDGESGTGFSAAGILSQRRDAATVHLNSVFSITRTHHPDLFLGAIIEGPYGWTVRPVAEVFAEQESTGPRTTSTLLGAIWRAGRDLSFDVGIREAHAGGEVIHEVRLGLTWSLPPRTQP
jgi:hypothetical protein